MEPGCNGKGKGVIMELEPFIYQVSGGSPMLLLDEKTICKPLIMQEFKFYQNAPDHLGKFMPEFKGVIDVTFSTDEEGYLNLTTSHSFNKTFDEQHCCKNKAKHRIRVCHSGSIQIESDSIEGQEQTFEEESQISVLNPWVLHCHQQQVNKIHTCPLTFNKKYMLLENLTWKYEFPCVLDIKMGTRQYEDDASDAKKQRLTAKMTSTTSAVLGVRIFGMQVYHHDSGHFICHNKYYGRSLTVAGFHQALQDFFYDGYELRKDVILELLCKLRKLLVVINSLDTFRFYTSSLLVIYDGKKLSCREQCLKENGQQDKHIQNDPTCHINNDKCNDLTQRSNCDHRVPEHEGELAKIVDVRIIDFAHSTQSLFSGHQNIGPDQGCIFGLENLISQLEKILEEEK